MSYEDYRQSVRQYPRVPIRVRRYHHLRRRMVHVVGFQIGPRGGHTALLVDLNEPREELEVAARHSDPGSLRHTTTRRADRSMMARLSRHQ